MLVQPKHGGLAYVADDPFGNEWLDQFASDLDAVRSGADPRQTVTGQADTPPAPAVAPVVTATAKPKSFAVAAPKERAFSWVVRDVRGHIIDSFGK